MSTVLGELVFTMRMARSASSSSSSVVLKPLFDELANAVGVLFDFDLSLNIEKIYDT